MSLESNTNLRERAYELVEELTSHPAKLDVAIQRALEGGDLEELEYWVTVGEGTLAQQEFYESNIIERDEPDVS